MSEFVGLPPVDRRLFIPDDVWVIRDSAFVLLSRRDDPQEWERVVALDDAITTQLKDGMWPMSSSSAPSLMAKMIEALRLEPGMKVLEIGSGTGYNSACLAALGADVVTVEIDQVVADHARRALRTAGFPDVVVIAGDGETGAPTGAPYDRVIATAAAHTIPYSWVEQTRDGGLIVAPYTGEGHKGGLLVLSVHDGKATGRVAGEAAFMPLRGQRMTQPDLKAIETMAALRIEVTPSGQHVTAG